MKMGDIEVELSFAYLKITGSLVIVYECNLRNSISIGKIPSVVRRSRMSPWIATGDQ